MNADNCRIFFFFVQLLWWNPFSATNLIKQPIRFDLRTTWISEKKKTNTLLSSKNGWKKINFVFDWNASFILTVEFLTLLKLEFIFFFIPILIIFVMVYFFFVSSNIFIHSPWNTSGIKREEKKKLKTKICLSWWCLL